MADSTANTALSRVPRRSAPRSRGSRAASAARLLDVIFLVVACAPFLALGAAPVGYAVGASAWLLQRIVAHTDRRFLIAKRSPKAQLGLGLAEAFGRIWLLAGAIAAAGLIGGRPDGLAAALVIFGAYSVSFAVRIFSGAPATGEPPARTPPPLPAARKRAQEAAITADAAR